MNEFPEVSGGITMGILEDMFDDCKASILEVLVVEGLLAREDADNWCKSHTIVARNKSGEYYRSFTSKDYGFGHPENSALEKIGKICLNVVRIIQWKSEKQKKEIRGIVDEIVKVGEK